MSSIKWMFYKLLLQVVGTKSPLNKISYPEVVKPSSKNYQWVFCTTIGELNACKPFINKIAEQGPLVLLTDRDCYQQAYREHFPDAVVIELTGSNSEAEQLHRKLPCSSLYICEVPCLPNDAPCRLGYGFLRTIKSLGANLYLVNGWIYGYDASCRQDAIERKLFTREYVNLFDKAMVQTSAIQTKLIDKGMAPEKLFVTGNMKFDALNDTSFQIKDNISQNIIDQLSDSSIITLVAGSVSQEWEYQLLLECFKSIYTKNPNTRLVIAPRHPEKQSQLDAIMRMADALELGYELKSEVTTELCSQSQVLILNTFGELRSYYACADVSYIGKNHNVLEPLTFGKPVVTIEGWESTYPSYPVYEIVTNAELLFVAPKKEILLSSLQKALEINRDEYQHQLKQKLEGLDTALRKNCDILFGKN